MSLCSQAWILGVAENFMIKSVNTAERTEINWLKKVKIKIESTFK